MAIIGRIRNQGVLITTIIGVALLFFVLQDLLSGKFGFTQSKQATEIAEVSGEIISYKEFEEKFQTNLENSRSRSRNSTVDEDKMREDTWQQMLNEKIMQKEYERLGIIVSNEELLDMVAGNNIHQVITSNFTDPKTNEFNQGAVKQFLEKFDDLPAESQNAWLELEEYMLKDRANQKYNNLVTKGLYVTTIEAKRAYTDQQKEAKFTYVVKRYAEIPDSTIEVSEQEINNYYEKNKEQKYKKEDPSRKIEYVTFDIVPSEQDLENIEKQMMESLVEFQESKEDSLFVSLRSETPFDDVYHTQDDLSEILDTTLFKAVVGTVYGPYIEDGYYKLAKLVSRTTRPDSVQARHILIRPSQQADIKVVQERIDSIKKAIE
jgi:peptidyl-prolyl cis-trans isomerase D